jgi:hypothetical protein
MKPSTMGYAGREKEAMNRARKRERERICNPFTVSEESGRHKHNWLWEWQTASSSDPGFFFSLVHPKGFTPKHEVQGTCPVSNPKHAAGSGCHIVKGTPSTHSERPLRDR